MSYKPIALSSLVVNKANDRHGELENEELAIAWLFNNREQHMRSLAKDIVEQDGIFEPPLVVADGRKFIVFDGNRRVTCLKLLAQPHRAPTTELQAFFHTLRGKWRGVFPTDIVCQVETDRDRVDDILFRRHTGSQSGVGQSTWDDRMKQTFVTRSGKGGGLNVADEIEKRLKEVGKLPARGKIPRSTLNRLLSAEAFRNRLGFTTSRGKFEFTHDEAAALDALARVANDLTTKKVVLGHLWDVDGKRSYLDELEVEGILPTARQAKKKSATATQPQPQTQPQTQQQKTQSTTTASRPAARTTLIPDANYNLVWPGRLQRHRAIWEELQFKLHLSEHPNAIAVLFRVLLELSIDNYIAQAGVSVNQGDNLAQRALKVGKDLHAKGKIDQRLLGMIKKFPQMDQLISADTLNRYVHSPQFSPSPEHLRAIWDSIAELIVQCLKV